MFSMKDAADLVASFGIVDAGHIWTGKLQDKVDESIGVYPLTRSGVPRIPIGGISNTNYDVKRLSVLVHWNKNVVEAERNATSLFQAFMDTKNVTINEQNIKFCQLLVPEPVFVGTDDNGVFEYVIEVEIYYER